jgi:hypothetical protein
MISPSNETVYRMNTGTHNYHHLNQNYENKMDLMLHTQNDKEFSKGNSLDNNMHIF